MCVFKCLLCCNYLINYILLIFEKGEERAKEKERNIDEQEKQGSVASCNTPVGDLACNQGMYPDWELNRQAFRLWDGAQHIESH